jgi:hypothetical protein
MHVEHSHWLHENFISKIVCHHFPHGVIALPNNVDNYLGGGILCFFQMYA